MLCYLRFNEKAESFKIETNILLQFKPFIVIKRALENSGNSPVKERACSDILSTQARNDNFIGAEVIGKSGCNDPTQQ